MAIYGWHRTNGLPIQPLYLKHSAAWVDYSQCVRLVQQKMVANETARTVAEVLADPALAGLLSDEGPLVAVRYPTNAPLALQTLTNQASVNRLMTNAAFDERLTSFTFNPEVKVRVNLPGEAAFAAAGKVLLIFYALPNGPAPTRRRAGFRGPATTGILTSSTLTPKPASSAI